MNETAQSWAEWVQDVAKTGLTRKWDAEYLERFTTAIHAAAPGSAAAAASAPQQPLAIQAAGGVAPLLVVGGVLLIGGLGLYLVLRD